MEIKNEPLEQMDNDSLAELITLMIHQIITHHGLYFCEAIHQFGLEKALYIMDGAWKKIYRMQIRRLSQQLGFALNKDNNIPQALLEMPREDLLGFVDVLGMNWLGTDGIWFQEIEENFTIFDAQRCAGGCILKFCAFEAWTIKRFLQLPEFAGLNGLKQALQLRAYHQINTQSIIEEGVDSIIFQMNECVVQKSRKAKGLTDYPCKATGIVEYRSFAQIIDPRITMECMGCPPDAHPDEWCCSWRFTMKSANE